MKKIAGVCVMSILAGCLCLCDALEAGSRRQGILGIEIKTEGGWLTVVGTVDNSPASRGDLLAGDRIVRIDGKSTENKALSDCLKQLAGAPGEDVTLTVVREGGAKRFELTLTRASLMPDSRSTAKAGRSILTNVLTMDRGPVRWKGNKIVSRVLPYPDLISLTIRLPIAHAAVTGRGVKVAVVQSSGAGEVSSMIEQTAPGADVKNYTLGSGNHPNTELGKKISEAGCRVAVIPDVNLWSEPSVAQLVGQLLADEIVVIIPSDLSEDRAKIETVNRLHSAGALTVGRLDRNGWVVERTETGRRAFNRQIRRIRTDVFSSVGLQPYDVSTNPVLTAAGVAALVLEKWPILTGMQVCEKIIAGGRRVWQGRSIETGKWNQRLVVDPVTSECTPNDEAEIFRFRALDAASSVGVDTEVPWILNMVNCHKAWEISKGKGTTVVVSDQGFHIKHPDLANSIKGTKHFGPRTFETPNQNFHGTEMSRILLAVAPEATIIPVLCSGPSVEELPANIAKSFAFAAEHGADVVTASWAGRFNDNEALLSAVRDAVDSGVVVSWFHYPTAYAGVLRSKFTYSWWETERSIGFADRFLGDRPGFYPVEMGTGLSGTAPQAAGVAALVKSANPALTPRQIEELIFENSTPIGHAILIPDAYKAVLAAKQLKGSPTSG